MNKPKKKLIGGIVFLLILCIVYWGFLHAANLSVNQRYSMDTRASQLKVLSRCVEKGVSMNTSTWEELVSRKEQKVSLETVTFEGSEPVMFRDGAVIRIDGDKIEFPKDFPLNLQLEAGEFTSGKSGFTLAYVSGSEDSSCIVYYIALPDQALYYIEWEPTEELYERRRSYFDLNSGLSAVEKAFNVKLLLFSSGKEDEGEHIPLYWSDGLPFYSSAEEYGITPEMIAGAADNFDSLSASDISDHYHTTIIDGTEYELFLQKLDNPLIEEAETSFLACLVPYSSTGKTLDELTRILLAIFLIIGVYLLAWYVSTLLLVRDHSLNESQKKEVSPGTTARSAFSSLLVGALLLFGSCALLLSLLRMYTVCTQVDTALMALEQRIKENKNQTILTESIQKETYEGFALQIAKNLETYPKFAQASMLQDVCDFIQADYIILFDSEGNETVTNSRYIDLSLGTDPDSSTYDFRRLLKGTVLITHDLEKDEQTGDEHVRIGVSYKDPEDSDKYAALLMAVPGDKIYNSTAESTSDILSSLVSKGMLAFSVDPETSRITNASRASLVGENVQELGLPEDALRDGWRDFFTLGGKSYYGECMEIGDTLYYYASSHSNIYKNVGGFSLVTALIAFLLLTGFVLFLLHGYKAFYTQWSEIGTKIRKSPNEVLTSGGKWKFSKDPSIRWKLSVEEYGMRTPYHFARRVAVLLLVICVLFFGILLFSSGFENSLILFILQGKWAKGINLFAFTSILILAGEVLVTVTASKLVLRLISNALGTKGETVCRLLSSLLSYAGIIFFVYFSLLYLGFKPNTLLASLGLLSFAISLGAKDLITDIIAGLSIVFEGEFQVGDIIDVGGYRGEVLEIGVRTTKLEGRGGNIKIIGNNDIKNVINMTRKNSWCSVEVNVSSDQQLNELETLLEEQLPKIGENIPKILSGPVYRGISSIGKGTVTLSIVAECNEENYFTVQRSLNHAIQELFESHGVKIL